jgi:5-methylcytosine-specific restriction endonuclease McrA
MRNLWLPRWLYIFWRRCIYLRSTGWWLTRRRVLRSQGALCCKCHNGTNLQVHHVNHVGQPKPKLWHFLPFARFLMLEQDWSKLVVLCRACHKREHRL